MGLLCFNIETKVNSHLLAIFKCNGIEKNSGKAPLNMLQYEFLHSKYYWLSSHMESSEDNFDNFLTAMIYY